MKSSLKRVRKASLSFFKRQFLQAAKNLTADIFFPLSTAKANLVLGDDETKVVKRTRGVISG